MKSIQSRTWGLLLVALFYCLPPSTQACNLSSLTLDSLTFDGSTYTVYVELCVGGGVIGSVAGAGGPTGLFALALYNGGTGTVGFSPATLTGDSTGSTYFGSVYYAPPVIPTVSGTGDSASSYIVYQVSSGSYYTCTNTNAQCGAPHSDCKQIILTMATLPDSISALGIEGYGNPGTGCHSPGYDSDITIDLTGYRIFWGGFDVEAGEEGVDLSWTALRERSGGTYRAMRETSTGEWTEIGQLPVRGASDRPRVYTLRDEHPHRGRNVYRIERVAPDGSIDISARRAIEVTQAPALNWSGIGPVPAEDQLTIRFESQNHAEVTVDLWGLDGIRHLKRALVSRVGLNELELDLARLPAGVYILELHSPEGTLHRKITKY